jgi:phosphopantetheinyl transferase (holo-ACP synthase)
LFELPGGMAMNRMEQIKEMVAAMLELPPERVTSETSLAGLETSLGVARLRLGLKRLGISLPGRRSPSTFGELEAALSGTASPAGPSAEETAPAAAAAPPAWSGLQVGIDIQDIRSLPAADDFWEHEFYRGIFGSSEIAYAVVQSDPRIHFAAFWCAKEALRKCDPGFLKVDPNVTVVAHERDGRPYLQMIVPSGAVRLPHAVSLSHTAELATAIVAASFPESVPPPASPPADLDKLV